jgi:heat shock protein HslJ
MTKIFTLLLVFLLVTIGLTGCESETTAVENTKWLLLRYGTQEMNLQAVIEGTEITATFNSKENQLTGSAGCNTYYGNYQINKKQLSISMLAWTEMACLEPEGVMEQEQQYLSTLQLAESYTIEDSELTVLCSNSWVLLFHAK